MTKNFCDICGEPAESTNVRYVHRLTDKVWHGFKSESVGGTDGRWVPHITIASTEAMADFKGDSRSMPDLCRPCYKMLLQKLIEEVK